MQRGHAELDQRVGAPLIRGARIVREADRGPCGHRRVEGSRTLGRQQRPQFAHPVRPRGEAHSPLGQRIGPLPAYPIRVGCGHSPGDRRAERRDALFGSPAQHPLLHDRGGLVAQPCDRLCQDHRLLIGDPPFGQRCQGAGQPGGQFVAYRQRRLRLTGTRPQRARHVLAHPVAAQPLDRVNTIAARVACVLGNGG